MQKKPSQIKYYMKSKLKNKNIQIFLLTKTYIEIEWSNENERAEDS